MKASAQYECEYCGYYPADDMDFHCCDTGSCDHIVKDIELTPEDDN